MSVSTYSGPGDDDLDPAPDRIERLRAEIREAWDARMFGVPCVRVAQDVYDELAEPFPKRLSGAGLRVEGCDVSPSARLDPGTWEIEP